MCVCGLVDNAGPLGGWLRPWKVPSIARTTHSPPQSCAPRVPKHGPITRRRRQRQRHAAGGRAASPEGRLRGQTRGAWPGGRGVSGLHEACVYTRDSRTDAQRHGCWRWGTHVVAGHDLEEFAAFHAGGLVQFLRDDAGGTEAAREVGRVARDLGACRQPSNNRRTFVSITPFCGQPRPRVPWVSTASTPLRSPSSLWKPEERALVTALVTPKPVRYHAQPCQTSGGSGTVRQRCRQVPTGWKGRARSGARAPCVAGALPAARVLSPREMS